MQSQCRLSRSTRRLSPITETKLKGLGMFTLKGAPRTKKNAKNCYCVSMTPAQLLKSNRRCGMRPVVTLPPHYRTYEEVMLWQLKGCQERYTGPVAVQAHYWLKDRRSWPDLIGLLQATSDILQTAGIIENDRDIVSYDGSRIVGLDKGNPRVEITIEEC